MNVLSPTFDQQGITVPAIRYLQERQSPGGGFCFYRSAYLDEPNISDTYHAVRALSFLGARLENVEQVGEFARSFLDSGQPLARYFAAWVLKCLKLFRPGKQWLDEIAHWPISEPPGKNSPQLTAWLEHTRFVIRLKSLFDAGHGFSHLGLSLRALEQPEGGFGNRPNLWDTWLALDILGCCGPGCHELLCTRQFVERLQVPVIGFALTEGSRTGNLDVLFAGLRCCRALTIPIRFSSAVLSLVSACQTGRGGFARAPGASPNIEFTYKAVWACSYLTQSAQGATHDEY